MSGSPAARRCGAGRLRWLVLALSVFGTPGVGAHDVAPDGSTGSDASIEPALVAELLEWIGNNSDYDVGSVLGRLPETTFCDGGETIHYEGRSLTVADHVKGLYDDEDYRIVLVRPWRAQDPFNVGTLLHELVHLVQYRTSDWVCSQSTEMEAYRLQEAWLMERGLDPGFNWVRIEMMSRCTSRDIHPGVDEDD